MVGEPRFPTSKDKEYLQKLIQNMDPSSTRVDDPEDSLVDDDVEEKPIEYVYIIQEREFIKEGRPLYKIGRTRQEPNKRCTSYPKGSSLHMMMSVPNCQEAEKAIKTLFKKKYKNDSSIGVEYFEGNVEEMKKDYIRLLL